MSTNSVDPGYLLTDQYRNGSNLSARNDLHVRFSTNKYGWRRWVVDRLLEAALPPNARILEVGAGTAWLWQENQDRIPSGWQITLSDFSAGMVEEANRNLAGSRGNFQFEIIDIQAIPFRTGTFDAVMANHMLYHVPNRSKAYAEVRRVLKPGGYLFAATNGVDHLKELSELATRFLQIDYWLGFSTRGFNLEDGMEQLAPYFKEISVYRYDDGLIVTEAEPIVAYMLSGIAQHLLDAELVEKFRKFVAQIIATDGPIHLTKDSGMFVARREVASESTAK